MGAAGTTCLIDQAVWASDTSAGRVLHAFGQYSSASEAASPFSKWYGAGRGVAEPFEGRPRDTLALGYGRAVPNPRSREVQELAAFKAAYRTPT